MAKRRKVVWCSLNDDRWWGGGYFLTTAAEPRTGISASAPNEELCITAAIFQINQTLRLCSVLWNSFCLFSSSCCCLCWCCCWCWKSDFRAENPHHIGGEWWVSPPSWWLGPTAACCTVTSCTVHHCTTVHQTCTVQHYTLHSISWSISNCQVNKYQINTTKIHPWSPSYKWQWQMAWLKTPVSFNWKHYISHAFQSDNLS